MKIAQVAPLAESVPPKHYGGTERVVSYLTEELVSMGHEVTLFATADSCTSARLLPMAPGALRLNPHCIDPMAHTAAMLGRLAKTVSEFDMVHFHCDYHHFPLMRFIDVPHVTTLHGRLDLPDLEPLFQEFCDMPVVSISNAQREPLPAARWQATVHHGLPDNLYTLQPEPGKYLALLGRVSPEKGVDRAIEIAIRSGMELKIAAKVDKVDREYFNERIKPLLSHPLVEFCGEIGEEEKQAFLGNAYALLFPIDWPEPFGLVMIEAMACGTPVIAYRRGSVAEVMREAETGYVVEDVAQAVDAVEQVQALSRHRCRRVFETCFSARRMAQDYLNVYRTAIEDALPPPRMVV